MSEGRIVVDGRPIECDAGFSVAVAIVRAGEVPGRGGALCLAGDCGNCLAEVDGIAYVRTCQVAARPGTVVRRHPPTGKPPLPVVDATDLSRLPRRRDDRVWRGEADTVVIGSAGWAPEVSPATVLDAAEGFEVVGLYPGPSVVARMPPEIVHLRAERVIVATGSAEILPVCPGTDLSGIVTARAAGALAAAGVAPQPSDALARFLEHYDRRLIVHTRPYDGIVDMLASLRARRVKRGVLTNKPQVAAERVLRGLTLLPWFDAGVIGAEGAHPRKPDPAGLRALAAAAGVPIERTVLVGDGSQDVETARRAGARVCVARYGYGFPTAEPLLVESDWVIDAPSELPALLRV